MASQWSLVVVMMIIIPILTESSSIPNDTTATQAESWLMDTLLKDYNWRIPPGRPLVVDLAIQPIKIIDVDVDNGLLTADVWLKHAWVDYRLQWDPDEFIVDTLRIPKSLLYIPTMELFYGNMKPLLIEPEEVELVVYNTGHVYFIYPVRAEVYCDIPTGSFRHAICNLTVGPWSRDASHIVITSQEAIQESSPRLQTGRCRIGPSIMRIENSTFECCPNAYSTARLYLSVGCHETASDARMAQAIHSNRVLVTNGNRAPGGTPLPVALAPFFVLLVFLMPPKSTDRVLAGSMVFLFLLIIWASGRMTEDQESFLCLSATTTLAATFVSLVSCRISSTDAGAPPESDSGDKRRAHNRCKTRLASMLDLIMFASVAVVLSLATLGTFT